MALVVSLLAFHVAFSSAVTISTDSEEAPVRRAAKVGPEADDEEAPVRREDDEGPLDPDALSLGQTEQLSLTALHKDWPRCQMLQERNWNTAYPGQHFRKMHVVPNVTSEQACAKLCGTYTYKQGDVDIPCATWTWVSKTWAKEFSGFQSCAMFGFLENEPGVKRAPVPELAFKSYCCVAGTPCSGNQVATQYQVSTDRIATAFHREERRRRAQDKMERLAAEAAAKKGFVGRLSAKLPVVAIIAGVLGLGLIVGVCAWRAGYAKGWF